ncbi:hypothetical protein V8E36_007553 [Tilletia maclaganii]
MGRVPGVHRSAGCGAWVPGPIRLEEVPSSSQMCINVLEPAIQPAFRAAYEVAKASLDQSARPDWTRIWSMHLVASSPLSSAYDVKARMEAFFEEAADQIRARMNQQLAALAAPRAFRPSDTPPAGARPADPQNMAPLPAKAAGAKSVIPEPIAVASKSAAEAVEGKCRESTRALREIARYQHSVEPLIPRRTFSRLVRDIAFFYHQQIHFSAAAISALQDAAEEYVVVIFQEAQAAADHAGRSTIRAEDMVLARRLRSAHKGELLLSHEVRY